MSIRPDPAAEHDHLGDDMTQGHRSAWRRKSPHGEHRWPSVAAVAVTVVIQLLLPESLVLQPSWLLPAVELALLVALVAASPVRIESRHPALRPLALCLVGAM